MRERRVALYSSVTDLTNAAWRISEAHKAMVKLMSWRGNMKRHRVNAALNS